MPDIDYKTLFDNFFNYYSDNPKINEYIRVSARICGKEGGSCWKNSINFEISEEELHEALIQELINELNPLIEDLQLLKDNVIEQLYPMIKANDIHSHLDTYHYYDSYGNDSIYGVYFFSFKEIGQKILLAEVYSYYESSFNDFLQNKKQVKMKM